MRISSATLLDLCARQSARKVQTLPVVQANMLTPGGKVNFAVHDRTRENTMLGERSGLRRPEDRVRIIRINKKNICDAMVLCKKNRTPPGRRYRGVII
jgi:hypothetical protein